MRTILTGFLMVFLLAPGSFASKSQYAIIDSLSGKAEVQRAGTQTWKPASAGDKLYTNDIIRALARSAVKLSWADGSCSYMHENSQIMLAMYESAETNVVSRHVTVFFGAVYFIVKEILPKGVFKDDFKVYTPTAVVSLRGTSFSVEVDNKTGSSSIKVVNGTVLVRNIIKNVALFIAAGFQTRVEMKTDPIVPKPLLSPEIDTLKTWFPAGLIGKEMEAQLAKAGRDHTLIAGETRDKAVVMPFVNTSKYAGAWRIGTGLAQMLLSQLKNNRFAYEAADSSATDPLAAGEKQKARFVIVGEVKEFDIAQHAEIAATADEYREYYLARVRISVQLIAMADKKIIYENDFSGDSRGPNIKENSWQKIAKLPFDLANQQFAKSLLGIAVQQALGQSAEKLLNGMAAAE
jgi:hypothetical protein